MCELTNLLCEGRTSVGRRNADRGLDMAMAIASFGVDRGIDSFYRFSFLMRNGQNFYATPLGLHGVKQKPSIDLIRETEKGGWLDHFRRACGGKNTPPRFPTALRRYESAVFDYCRHGGAGRFQEILCSLGWIEREISLLGGEVGDRSLRPLPTLSPAWITAAYDGSTEFRLALSLASMKGDREGKVKDLRANLEPVEWKKGRWSWIEKGGEVAWSGGDLPRNLRKILERRLMDAGRRGLEKLPLDGIYKASLRDAAAFIEGETDDRKIEALLWGLVLVDRTKKRGKHLEYLKRSERGGDWEERFSFIPRPYALLKLLFLPHDLEWPRGAEKVEVRPEPESLGRLRRGDVQGALEIAARRLGASGFTPMPGPTSGGRKRKMESRGGLDASRLAAALLLPIWDVKSLADMVLRKPGDGKT